MTSPQILKKAVEKAIANGWLVGTADKLEPYDDGITIFYGRIEHDYSIPEILFSPDFARAFFDDDHQTHQLSLLMEVQAGRDPIKLLERHL